MNQVISIGGVALLALVLVLAVACSRTPPAGSSTTAGGGPDSVLLDQEHELDWLEMMPAEELAAYERGDGPAAEHSGNRAMPQFGTFNINASVLDRPVRLPGYVVPLSNDGKGRLVEFLFVPYYGACIHVPPPPPNQIVHVRLREGIEQPDMYSPFFLTGRLQAERTDDDLAGSAYTMAQAGLRPYE